ncbi:glycosyltransferase family 4 protein [Streptomyces albipurpureus]|uniref:Glycosyltransferase family 4 protein n=1 Tax=Streptomyces albipurpureus TaxID=2897419 RepID=A0ABT0UN48_9ACTN|nr:glycosyltransferase family 4 protein [Streptomyces sp. CWNU-1]MCM2389510.1 glycosyltransferase family 4 protein [Streptomyces sp. CWNU-1]
MINVRAARPHRYDLTVALTYYLPYTSGLTEVARTVAEGLAARGRRVAVVASRHDPSSPVRERVNGVDVFRAPVAARIGRGVLSPGFLPLAARLARASRAVNIHLPMLEAGPLALLAGRTPVITTHHDDVWLPPGRLAGPQVRVVDASVATALRRSAAVVVNNADHAEHSRHWPLMRDRLAAIAPPCRERQPAPATFREGPGPHFGFLGRIAPEKGLHHLVDAFRTIEDPAARLLIAGDYSKVAGGSVVGALRERSADDPRIRFTGFLPERQIAAFYSSLDVFALPSVAEESFGISQTEAMMMGVPSVASDAPGMRVPVTSTGFGRLFPPGDIVALATALLGAATLSPRQRAEGGRATRARYGTEGCLDSYDALLGRIGAAGRVTA